MTRNLPAQQALHNVVRYHFQACISSDLTKHPTDTVVVVRKNQNNLIDTWSGRLEPLLFLAIGSSIGLLHLFNLAYSDASSRLRFSKHSANSLPAAVRKVVNAIETISERSTGDYLIEFEVTKEGQRHLISEAPKVDESRASNNQHPRAILGVPLADDAALSIIPLRHHPHPFKHKCFTPSEKQRNLFLRVQNTIDASNAAAGTR